MEKREFFIDTPLGKLKVYAKHEKDCPVDYPGVFVDWVREDGETLMLACTEYDSGDNSLMTCVYQPGADEPVEVVHHDLDVGEKARFISVWDGGFEVRTPCKVYLTTRQVYDIEPSDISGDDVECLEGEFVELPDGTRMPVHPVEEIEDYPEDYWYK